MKKYIVITYRKPRKGEIREAWTDLPKFCKAHELDYKELRNAQQRQGKERFPVQFGKFFIEQIESDRHCFVKDGEELVEFKSE